MGKKTVKRINQKLIYRIIYSVVGYFFILWAAILMTWLHILMGHLLNESCSFFYVKTETVFSFIAYYTIAALSFIFYLWLKELYEYFQKNL